MASNMMLNRKALWDLLSKPAALALCTPVVVSSRCQASRNTSGKPRITMITTRVGTHSGRTIPIGFENCDISIELDDKKLVIDCICKIKSRTGVEMEALTATSVCCLTIYDMTKSIDRSGEISSIKLISKSGGKSGNWKRR